MDARAAPNAASESVHRNGDGPSPTSDPLQRLEAELKATVEQPNSTEHCQPDGAQLYEEAQRLLEEAWSIFTECQVMRDGLLAACEEIERTMDSIQLRLGGLPAAIASNGNGHLSNGKPAVATSSNGAGPSSNGVGPSSNGVGPSSNGAGPSSNGAGHSSNGAGPH